MKRAMFQAFSSLLLALGTVGEPTVQPATQKGRSGDSVFTVGEVDTVNTANGNLTLTIPLGQQFSVSADFTYQFALHYNSKVWDYELDEENLRNPPRCGEYDAPGDVKEIRRRAVPGRRSNAGFGWTTGFGRLWKYTPGINHFNDAESWTYQAADGSEHVFHAYMRFEGEAPPGCSAYNCPSFNEKDPDWAYTMDSTYLRLRKIPGAPKRWEVHFPNGEIHTFDEEGKFLERRDLYGNWLRVGYEYLNGSTWDTAADGQETRWHVTDGNGNVTYREHFVTLRTGVNYSQPNLARIVSKVDLAAFGGKRVVYELTHEDSYIEAETAACGETFQCGSDGRVVPLLRAVKAKDPDTLATLLEWLPAYHYSVSFGEGGECSSGLIASLTTPALGQLSWKWRKWQTPQPRCLNLSQEGMQYPSSGIAERTVTNGAATGTWTYVHTFTDPVVFTLTPQDAETQCGIPRSGPNLGHRFYPAAYTEVEDPAGDRSRYYYSTWTYAVDRPDGTTYKEFGQPLTRATAANGRFLSTEVYDCSLTDCNLKRETFVTVDGDAASPILMRLHNPRRSGEYVRWKEGANETYWKDTQRSDFDQWGRFRTERHTSSDDPNWFQETYTDWNVGVAAYPTDWLAQKFSIVRAWEGNSDGSTYSEKQYLLDAAQEVKAVRTLAGPVASANDHLMVLTREQGNVVREEWFGGDACPPSMANAPACSRWGLPLDALSAWIGEGKTTPVTDSYSHATVHTWKYGTLESSQSVDVQAGLQPGGASPFVSFKNVDCVVDQNTGFASSCKDAGGITTGYYYDLLGRLTESVPAAVAQGDPRTRFVYTSATASQPAKTEIITLNNSGSTQLFKSEVRFDGFGRAVDRRVNIAGQMMKSVTTYDVFGRTTSQSLPVPESAVPEKTTQYQDYDPFGRVGVVVPPDGTAHRVEFQYRGDRIVDRTTRVATSPAGESEVTVRQVYDGAGRLAQVLEPWTGSASAALTNTTYRYNVLGNVDLVSMTSGTVTQYRAFNYDARGLLLSESHPEGSTLYQGYDAKGNAHRVLRGNGAFDVRYGFDKASRLTNVVADGQVQKESTYHTAGYGNGRVLKATRHNRGRFSTGSNTSVAETFSYDGRGGRLSTTVTEVGTTESYLQEYSYTASGASASQKFATCVSASGCRSATVTHSFLGPTLTGLSGYVSSISYHPTGSVAAMQRLRQDGTIFTDSYPVDDAGRLLRVEFASWESLPPVITSVTPNVGPLSGGTGVLITGSRLRKFATVTFGGVPATAVQWVNDSQLLASVPARAYPGTVDVTVTNPDGGSTTKTQAFYYEPPPVATAFYTVTPCRVLDTRNANGAYGGPALSANGTRSFTIAGQCGIPANAKAVAANVTVVTPAANGELSFFPGNGVATGATAHSFVAGGIRANNAVLPLATDSQGTLGVLNRSAGATHFILDVSGYFAQPPSAPAFPALAASATVAPNLVETWSSGDYQYDGAGNIKAIGPDRFVYDGLGRLVQATIPRVQFPSGAADRTTQSFTYDGFGNLTSLVSNPALPTDRNLIAVDAATNRIAHTDGWYYDAAGQVTLTGGGVSLQWDAIGTVRQRSETNRTEVYLYTAGDERIASFNLNGTSRRTLRDAGNRVVRELTATGTTIPWSQTVKWERDWIYRGNAIVASEGVEGRRNYHLDHLGTPRLVTGGQGVRTAFHTYYPFGGEATPDQDDIRLKFTGHERDFAPGSIGSPNALDYMHARFYAPGWGRFLSVDLGRDWDAATPQTWNMYAYVRNKPVNMVDPTGNWAFPWELLDLAAYHQSSREWTESFFELKTNPTWGNAGNASLKFVVAALDGAALLLPAIPAAGGHTQRVVNATTETVTQLQKNKATGDAFRDKVADFLTSQGREVKKEVVKHTPFGDRRIDIQVSLNGKILGGIETKTGNSRYTTSQRIKDWWLRTFQNYPVNVVREAK